MLYSPPLCLIGIPSGPLIGLCIAEVLLLLLLIGIRYPLVWVVVALIALGAGVGCAGYGITRAALLSTPRSPRDVEWISIFIGSGAGSTIAGIVMLVVGLVRSRRRSKDE